MLKNIEATQFYTFCTTPEFKALLILFIENRQWSEFKDIEWMFLLRSLTNLLIAFC